MAQKKLTRRGFLGTAAGAGLGSLALTAVPVHASADEESDAGQSGPFWGQYSEEWKSRSNQPPRKVIVGTVMQPFWGKHPGLDKRLEQLTDILDRQQAAAQKQYGRGVDLMVLPEIAVTGEGTATGHVSDWAVPLEGPVQDTFSRKAREHHAYIVVSMYMVEDHPTKQYFNANVLFGRQGEVVGIYRKMHLVVDDDGEMERGCTPGKETPVFDCDFGRLGIQVCYDIQFESGWRELARRNADIVAWPSESPGRARPVPYAIEGHYYIVSSTWRKDACVIEPTGKIIAEVDWKPSMGSPNDRDPMGSNVMIRDNILVHEIDLSYAFLPYSGELQGGELFRKTFGDRAGFHYYDDEDRGIFWSNDPNMTVRQMVESLNLEEEQDQLRHARVAYRKAGVPGY